MWISDENLVLEATKQKKTNSRSGSSLRIITPLITTVTSNYRDESSRKTAIIQHLVRNGAQVNQARYTDGWTPLFLAAIFNMRSVVSLLLQMGAETFVMDSKGRIVASVGELVKEYHLNNVRDLLEYRSIKETHES